MSKNYAIVDGTGTVSNVIAWDGVTPYAPPTGTTLILDPTSIVGRGWTYANGIFTNPNAGD